MSMGVAHNEFWNITPRDLSDYSAAYNEQMKRLDYEAWLQGRYVYEAVAVAIGNAFRKKGSKALEYSAKPYLELQRDKDIETGKIKLSEREQAELALQKLKLIFGEIPTED